MGFCWRLYELNRELSAGVGGQVESADRPLLRDPDTSAGRG
jgi:hypothetical protein